MGCKHPNITAAWLRGGAGKMGDRRLKRQKTRATAKRAAIKEG